MASGGELSRISLALEVVGTGERTVTTMVFDEVDVGIGGATAEVGGSLLRELGNNAQITRFWELARLYGKKKKGHGL